MNTPHPPDAHVDLSARLRRVRRRLWAVRALRLAGPIVVLVGVAAGATVLLVDADVVVPALLAAGAGTLLVCAAAAAAAWRATRRPEDVARHVDRTLGLAGRCGAVQAVAAKRHPNRVERALLASIPGWIDEVEPRAVVPVRPGRALVAAVPVWLTVALAATWAPELARVAVPADAAPAAHQAGTRPMSAEDDVNERLERFRYLLVAEAEERQDPELLALADEAERLTARLDRGEVPSAEVWSEIDSLSERAAHALGFADDPTFRAGDGDGGAEAGTGARPATARDRPDPLPDDGRHDDGVDAMDAPAEDERPLDGLLDRMETRAMARSAPDADADLSDVSLRPSTEAADQGTYFDNPEIEAAAQAALATAEAITRADVGGAAAGDALGAGGTEAGGAALGIDEGRAGTPLGELDFERERLSLPGEGTHDGRRLQVRASPNATLRAAAAAAPVATDAWRRTAESVQGSDRVPPGARAAVAAFHTPLRQEAP